MALVLDPILTTPPPPDVSEPDTRHQTEKWYAITTPANFITADQLARHMRLDRSDANAPGSGGPSDAELGLYIAAAVDYAEGAMETSLAPRSIVATFQDCEPMVLPRGPVIGVQSIQDSRGNAITAFDLRTFGRRCEVILKGRVVFPVSVTYLAGYAANHTTGDTTTPVIPPSIVSAILMHAATLFAQRESISDKPLTAVPHALDAFYAKRRQTVGVA